METSCVKLIRWRVLSFRILSKKKFIEFFQVELILRVFFFFFISANAVKDFNDIDVFIPVDVEREPELFTSIAETLMSIQIINDKTQQRLYTYTRDIIQVTTVGRLQLILKFYASCPCHFHLDRFFFSTFHHATRYRLLFLSPAEREWRIPKFGPAKIHDLG